MGLMQATPGEMKSFRSSAERMALMVGYGWRRAAWKIECAGRVI